MARRLTYTAETGAVIRGARLVGTPLRACAAAAGVPYLTLCGWLSSGRAYNAAEASERDPKHAALGAFAAEIDRASGQCASALHARVMKATEKDGRLALEVLRWNEERATRKLKRDLVAAQVEVETLRISGLLPPEKLTVTHDARDALAERFARLAGLAGPDCPGEGDPPPSAG